jgi:Fuc2NAc and GlcNAc transferase
MISSSIGSMNFLAWSFVLLGVTGSWALTAGVRHYALARSLLDVPTDRSSHSVPTPRGGGAAIALVCLVGVTVGVLVGAVARDVGLALVGGGILVAGVGWLDDHRGLPAWTRALVHLGAAVWALAWLRGLPALTLGTGSVPLGVAGWVVGALVIMWCTNLYNFMDGIDGLAAAEAASVGLAGGALLLSVGASGLAVPTLLIVAGSAGFLAWNWAPAKIFMGDVGSGLLGFLFGTLAIASENAHAMPLVAWMVLLGVFVFDATVTLVRRMLRGERWHQAHRSHAYQRMAASGWTHDRVTRTVLILNAVLILLAGLAVWRPVLLLPGLLGAVLLLTMVYQRVERVAPPA